MRLATLALALLAPALTPLAAAVTWSVGVGGHGHGHHHHHHDGIAWGVAIGTKLGGSSCRPPAYVHRPAPTVRVVTPCAPRVVRSHCATTVVRHGPPRVVVHEIPRTTTIIVNDPPVACGRAAHVAYHGNGQVQVRGQLRDGLRDGNWTWFDDRGVMNQQGCYIRGIREGLWVRYDRDGRVAYQATYDDGRLVSETVYNAACSGLLD